MQQRVHLAVTLDKADLRRMRDGRALMIDVGGHAISLTLMNGMPPPEAIMSGDGRLPRHKIRSSRGRIMVRPRYRRLIIRAYQNSKTVAERNILATRYGVHVRTIQAWSTALKKGR